MKAQFDLSKGLDSLADLFPFGHLQAQTDPAEFIRGIIREIKRLRKYAELFGNAVDHWEGLPNDIKTDPAMCKLNEAMERVLTEVE